MLFWLTSPFALPKCGLTSAPQALVYQKIRIGRRVPPMFALASWSIHRLGNGLEIRPAVAGLFA